MNPEEEIVLESIPYSFPDVENNEFVDPTPDDPTDKDDIVIFLLERVLGESSNYHSEYKVLHDLTNTKLDSLQASTETGDSNLGDTNTQLLTKLDTLIESTNVLTHGSNTVFTYGVLYIPLIIICFLLWRFFATFLRSAR